MVNSSSNKQQRRSRSLAAAGRGVPVAAAAGALGAALWLGGPSTRPVTAQDPANLTQEQRSTATSLEGAFEKVADSVGPATVSIKARIEEPGVDDADAPRSGGGIVPPGTDGDDEDSPFGGLPFPFRGLPRGGFPRGGFPRGGGGVASGSGVIVRQDGYILTNDHVVAKARDNTVQVTLNDGRKLPGKVFRDQRSDLAVVKIEAGKPLPYVRLADSSRARVGQWAIAIGSPFGQQNTMTAGIVSALHRKSNIGLGMDGRYYPNLIQTDASINPGNSGGPLLNINGELMGINVAIYSPSGGNIGIGYAIPSNTAKSIMEQLIARGKVVRGYLGLNPQDVDLRLQDRLGVTGGAYVNSISGGSPAQKAGIHADDVITRFGETEITNEVDLRDAIGRTAPGTPVQVTVLRNRQPRTLSVTVGAPDDQGDSNPAPVPAPRAADKLGMRITPLTADTAQELKLTAGTKGLVVAGIQMGSPASEAGLSRGDVITAVNGKAITTPEALNQAVAGVKSGDLVTFTVLRSSGNEDKPSEAVVNVEIP